MLALTVMLHRTRSVPLPKFSSPALADFMDRIAIHEVYGIG